MIVKIIIMATCKALYSSMVRSSFFFLASPPMNGSDNEDSTVPGCRASRRQPLCDLENEKIETLIF